jgi:GT2 family glycosyltransferase
MTEFATSLILLAYGTEPYLGQVVLSALETTGDDVEILVVDNGAADAVAALPDAARLTIHRPGRNLGYAEGCNYGASKARGQTLVFLNSDAVCLPGAVDSLVGALADPAIGLASGDIRLADAPQLMNSAGNPVHYLGIVWAGSYGEPAAGHTQRRNVSSASGAFLGVRKTVWESLGGFNDVYFAYHEDTDLSLRVWQRGLRVVFVPGATVLHHYEFARTPTKQYLLERNRWMTVLTVYPAPLLIRILPLLLAFDVALAAVALLQGWLPAKVHSWLWLLRHTPEIRRRRAQVQAARITDSGDFAQLLSGRIEPAMIERPPGLGAFNLVLGACWRLIRWTIR